MKNSLRSPESCKRLSKRKDGVIPRGLWPLGHSALKKPRGGSILFLAVASIAVLSILALGASANIAQELKLLKFLTDSNTSFYYAVSAVETTKVLLKNDKTPLNITFYDLQPRQMKMDDRTIDITLSDEESRVNIRTAPKETLMRLPGISGNAALVDALKASNPLVKEDVLLVGGITKDIYDELKNNVTVFGGGGVNINTAAPEVLALLGMDTDLIQKIHVFRAGEDGAEGTADDLCFFGTGDIVTDLGTYGISKDQKDLLDMLIASGQLATTSDDIALTITVSRGRVLRSFKIVVNLATGSIVSWLEA